jgi:isoleucyl-tRNA synthetase
MAPLLPVTADELWRFLPGGREPSVHLAQFPSNLAELQDDQLIATWERLIAVRDQVNAAIETMRQQKMVGMALEAHVTLRASGDLSTLLEQYRDQLPMLFIVSKVTLERDAAAAGDSLSVSVGRVDGTRCARCWRYVPSVSREEAYAGLCDRCVDAVRSAPAAAGSR